MLSDFEKKEIRRDAASSARRNLFRKSEKDGLSGGRSLDSYLRFLKNVETVFTYFVSVPGKTITRTSQL